MNVTFAKSSRTVLLVCMLISFGEVIANAAGTVIAWGENGRGQANVPLNLKDVIAVAAGNSFSLALRACLKKA